MRPRPVLQLGETTSVEERALVMGALYMGGEPMETIAARFDLSRERVRQIITKSGVHPGYCSRVDLALLGRVRARVESGEARSLRAACQGEPADAEQIRQTFQRLGLAHPLAVQAARNRCYQIVMALLERYRAQSRQLGRTPTAKEWEGRR